MRGLLVCTLAISLSLGAGGALAQDAGVERVEVRRHVVRAPDRSLQRGWLDVPAWVVLVAGGAIAVGAAGALTWRLVARKRR